MMHFLKNLAQLLFFPEKGWTDIVCSTASSTDLYRRCYLPFIIVVSLSAFVQLFYGAEVLVSLQRAIVEFFSLFLSYHISCLALNAAMPKLTDRGVIDPNRYAIFAAYVLSVVGLIQIIANAIKVQLALVQFLPLYAAFIVWKGSKIMCVEPGKEAKFTAAASIALLGSAYLLGWSFSIFI